MAIKNKSQVETTDHNMSKLDKSKKMFEIYFDYMDFREKPASENFIIHLGEEWIKWCANSKGTKASQFFRGMHGINTDTLKRWKDKYPLFGESYEFGLALLGDKREQGAIEKRYSEKMIMHRMHAYDPEWKTSDKYHSDLKGSESNSNEPKIVIMKDFPSEDKK